LTGIFYGVGVGPGSPDLLTLRAINVLKTADVICLPRSGADNSSVAMQVAGPHIPKEVELVEIATPMTRDENLLKKEWKSGAKKIAGYLARGKNVAFITIGDALLFSTYSYLLKELLALMPEARIETVPGVTSFAGAAAHLNIALAEGTQRLAIIPAVDEPEDLVPILEKFPNVVLMKVATQYEGIVDVLDRLGLKDKAVFVSKVGYPDEFVTFDLDSLRGVKRDYLSLILVKREGL
jgi:precorrin-2/cobalt-factor-2 C20-methyltransferase